MRPQAAPRREIHVHISDAAEGICIYYTRRKSFERTNRLDYAWTMGRGKANDLLIDLSICFSSTACIYSRTQIRSFINAPSIVDLIKVHALAINKKEENIVVPADRHELIRICNWLARVWIVKYGTVPWQWREKHAYFAVRRRLVVVFVMMVERCGVLFQSGKTTENCIVM
jgi:hypothetical protein